MVRKSSSLGFILKRLIPYAFVLEGFKFCVWIQKIVSFIYRFASIFFIIGDFQNWYEYFFWDSDEAAKFWKITCVAKNPVI